MNTSLERAIQRIERYRRRNSDAFRLARLASLAVRVEPYLLRRLRLELLSEADVGTEADLWFSPLVESRGTDAIVLDVYVVDVLREDLAKDRELLHRVKKITEASHKSAPPSIRLEENLNAIALLNEGDVIADIDKALHPALRALVQGGNRAWEIAHWAMRALPRFHPTVRQSEGAIALLLAASLLLGRRLLKQTPDADVEPQNVAWILTPDALSERVSLGVALIERGIRFLEPGSDSPTIELPRTTPLLLGLSWMRGPDRMEILIEAEPDRLFDLGTQVSEVTLRTLVGDEYLLERDAEATKAVDATEQTQVVIAGPGFELRRSTRLLTSEPVTDMRWSTDGHNLALATVAGKIYMTSPQQTGDLSLKEIEFDPNLKSDIKIAGMAWSPHGETLAIGDSQGHVVVADRGTGKPLYVLDAPGRVVRALNWSPDAALLAAAPDGIITVWETGTDALEDEPRMLSTGGGEVSELAFSPSGDRIAAAGQGNSLSIWDVAKWVIVQTLTGRSENLTCLAWSPDGKRVAAGSEDGRVMIWNAATGALLQSSGQDGDAPVTNMVFLSDSHHLITAKITGIVEVWRINAEEGPKRQSALTPPDEAKFIASVQSHEPTVAMLQEDGELSLWNFRMPEQEKTCFVIMGFGKKTDYRTGRTLDLDITYDQIIRAAVEDAGLECVRADEELQPGIIMRPMVEMLLRADVVVVDLSTLDAYTIYKLGIRHALRPHTTIIMAEKDSQLPFDIGHLRVYTYEHRGDSIDADEVHKTRKVITQAIRQQLSKAEVDSPVYQLLEEINPPTVSDGTPQSDYEPGESQLKKCFVIMGFGKKTDHRTGRTLDLDIIYDQIIRKAVEDNDLECFRTDDMAPSDIIARPVFEWLLNADLVVADLSTSNPDLLYELGIRHALRPRTTIIMAEKDSHLPLDIRDLRIYTYEHRAEGIDHKEVERMRAELRQTIQRWLLEPTVDSPVYQLLPDLQPPESRLLDMEPPDRGTVYLSYAIEDISAAENIANALQQIGLDVWLDRQELKAGDRYESEIKDSIDNCGLFIPIISKNALTAERRFFRMEWQYALRRAKKLPRDFPFIVPVAIDDTAPTEGALPEEFSKIQWLSLTDGRVSDEFLLQMKQIYK